MAVRMKDIARDLNVSVVTVSKVLRNHSDISQETRERVMRRMKELRYQPNLAARGLVTGRSYMMGLVVPDLVHSFFAQVAKSMTAVLRGHGYNLVISSSNEDPELEQQEIEQLLGRRVDVLIVASSQKDHDSLQRVDQHRTPYILIDRKVSGLAANFVGVDDEAVGEMATEHLIAAGCRTIAHIGGPPVSTALGRLNGYRRAMLRNGRSMPSAYVVTRALRNDLSDAAGYQAMAELLRLNPRPDGVFCYNDPTAMGAMKAILDARLRIPEDVAIVGCGNLVYADLLRVPLTSVDQDSEGIGEQVARLALDLISPAKSSAKSPAKHRTILLQPRLVIRQSSLRPPTN